MAYTTIDNPELYFQTKLYTGNGSTQSITLDGSENMQPDWIFLKPRSQSGEHGLSVDSVRGNTKVVFPNLNNAEQTITNIVTAFGSDGFSLGDNAGANNNTSTYASWNWKAGTSFSNDASATSVGSIDSTGSVNTTAGFSIISYTGTGSAATVAHGLGVAPSVYFLKNRTSTSNWFVYHKSTGATKSLFLDGSDAAITSSGYFNNTEPTSSVFSIGSESDLSGSSQNMIAYCFAEKKGYSKFGSYTGNGNADGVFVYLGFKPAFFLCKDTDNSNDWVMFDNKRDPHNVVAEYLRPNLSNAASSSTNYMDFTSNGIKHRVNDTWNNGSGRNYIYMAFAESPFVNSKGVPTNAR